MKKVKNKASFFAALAAVVFGVVAIFLPLATAYATKLTASIGPISGTANGKITSAYSFIFGAGAQSIYDGASSDMTLYRPATTGLIGWILLVLGILALAGGIFLTLKKNRIGKFVLFGAAVLLIASGILLLCVKQDLVRCTIQDLSHITSDDINQAISLVNMKLGFGFIGTAIFAFLSAACSAVAGIFSK